MQEYIMHNYEKIYILEMWKVKKSRERGDEVQEICEVVEENGIPMKLFVKMRISVAKSVNVKDICTRE